VTPAREPQRDALRRVEHALVEVVLREARLVPLPALEAELDLVGVRRRAAQRDVEIGEEARLAAQERRRAHRRAPTSTPRKRAPAGTPWPTQMSCIGSPLPQNIQ